VTEIWVGGVAICGPGLDGWEASRAVLAGQHPYVPLPPVLPPPAMLAPNERRRAGQVTRLALSMAQQAAAMHGALPAELRSIFGSASGDGATVNAILDAMTDPNGAVSPTQFHNSVHNAAAGYWSIGIGSSQAASCIAGHDFTVATGLLQAAAEAHALRRPVLLCLYDCPLPEPLHERRPIGAMFGAALVLLPEPAPHALARLRIAYADVPSPQASERPRHPDLAALSTANPIARMLRLLETLAMAVPDTLTLALLDGRVEVEVTPC
jgi:Beta-ketoacyl synthase, N-terminal domain